MTKIVVDHENVKKIEKAYESLTDSYYNATRGVSRLLSVLELATVGELISAIERIDKVRNTLDQALADFAKRSTD